MAAATPTYVYGIRKASHHAPGGAGIAGAKLHEIEADGLAALVSDLPGEELQFGKDELQTHARVLEEALGGGTVLPMRFGVVLESEDAVISRVLRAHHDELEQQLEEFDGKVELRVRAIYDEPQLMREIIAENVQVAKLRDRVRSQPDDATYFDRIQLGELIVEAIEHKRTADADRILGELEPLARTSQLGPPTHERMVLNASFLVDRDRIAEFDKAVDKVGREQADRMRLKYTGPLPPHSFAELATARVSEA